MPTSEERRAEYQRIIDLAASGYAGTLPGGLIVDRREHPEAVPMPKNTLLGVPEPKPVESVDVAPFRLLKERETEAG